MFALLIRTMLTKKHETYKGCCTASWIALVFGGDPSSIKSARAQLIADGWFARLETPQRVGQRYGEWVVLVIEQPVESHDETEPPLENQSLSHEIETNQSLQPGASQPAWKHIQSLDLHTPKRREQLYHAAVAAGVIPPADAHRHTFFAAVAHATRVAWATLEGSYLSSLRHPPITGSFPKPKRTKHPFGSAPNNTNLPWIPNLR